MAFLLGNFIPISSVLLIIFVLSLVGFIRVPMDRAAFISGFKRRVVTGKLAFYLRYFERVDYLDLSLFSVDVNTSVFVPTNDFINIKADAIVKLQISQEPEILNIASKNFLNKKSEYIGESVKEVLEGNLREIIGQMNLKDMVQNRKEFNVKVQENVSPDLREMGLVVVSFAVQSFMDEKGVIDNLGIENISKISKDASIAKAQAEKEIAIAKANADKEAKDIELKVAEEIAEKTNKLEIKKADLKIESDTKKASADMTYQLETERSSGGK
jgi:band 7 protein